MYAYWKGEQIHIHIYFHIDDVRLGVYSVAPIPEHVNKHAYQYRYKHIYVYVYECACTYISCTHTERREFPLLLLHIEDVRVGVHAVKAVPEKGTKRKVHTV